MLIPRLIFASLLSVSIFGLNLVHGATGWKPAPDMTLQPQRLHLYSIGRNWCETHFDATAGLIVRDPRKPHPHMVFQSALYARGLLMTKDPADRALAEKILRIVLTKQDLQIGSATYGSFLPYTEDS